LAFAGDEALDRLDDAGDAIGQAPEPLGGHGEVVLGRNTELRERRLGRRQQLAGVSDAGLGHGRELDEAVGHGSDGRDPVGRQGGRFGGDVETVAVGRTDPLHEHQAEDHGDDHRRQAGDEQRRAGHACLVRRCCCLRHRREPSDPGRAERASRSSFGTRSPVDWIGIRHQRFPWSPV
jgi:hypothetical protein